MHLESPDKRPTEYGQNLKEFVLAGKLHDCCLHSGLTTDMMHRQILAVDLLILSLSLLFCERRVVSILKES